MNTGEAKAWFNQAESDLRAATALRDRPPPMTSEDVGCHVAAMCAQAIEKSIKAYVIVNGATPSLGHRPDKYLPQLLTKNDPLLRYKDHHRHLSKLFDLDTRRTVEALLDLTPGGKGSLTDVANTEYPWKVNGAWKGTPVGSSHFGDGQLDVWLKLAKRVSDMLHKLLIAAQRGADL